MASRAAISQRRPTRLASARPTGPSRGPIAHQPARGHRFVGPLDAHPLPFTQRHGVLDQPRGRLRQHHPARGRHRFHPLGKPDRLAGRGVAQRPQADLTGNHPARIQAHPQAKIDTVAALHFGRQPVGLLLDGQRGQTPPKCMILQRNRGAEDPHHPVAGGLHRPAAVALHHRCRASHQLGHDLAIPLHLQRGREVHRVHHIGEEHRHLLVLRRCCRSRNRRTALVAELRVRRHSLTARPAHQRSRCHLTRPRHCRSTSLSCHCWPASMCHIAAAASGQRARRTSWRR